MPSGLFLQNTIAVIWDFDKTLIPGYMQQPLFQHFGVDEIQFWNEVNKLEEVYKAKGAHRVSKDSLYLNHILTYVQQGVFRGLNNKLLRELGAKLDFYPGLPNLFAVLKEMVKSDPIYAKHEIHVEHYIVSTGLREMIMGSKIAEFVDDVWGCEFVEGSPGPGYLDKDATTQRPSSHITNVAYAIDNTSKTRAIFEINKGTNKLSEIDVNASVAHPNRRIPFVNMVYVADGPSDVPVFSILNQYGGRTFAVYKSGAEPEFAQVKRLQEQGRVHSFGEAVYTEGTQTYMWLRAAVREIADRIAKDRARVVAESTGAPPTHIVG